MISMELKYPEERLGGSEYMDSFQHEERRLPPSVRLSFRVLEIEIGCIAALKHDPGIGCVLVLAIGALKEGGVLARNGET